MKSRPRSLACAVAVALAAAGSSLGYDSSLDLPISSPKKTVGAPDPDDQNDDKGPTIYGTELKSSSESVFYVIDISGSMTEDKRSYQEAGVVKVGDRLDRAKAELVRSISSLPKQYSFNATAYDCDFSDCFSGMLPADDANKAKAYAWARALKANGATGTAKAVCHALDERNNRLVVLITDGAPNCNTRLKNGNVDSKDHREEIREYNLQKATINVFGIGAKGVFKQFCVDVAADNNGIYKDAE